MLPDNERPPHPLKHRRHLPPYLQSSGVGGTSGTVLLPSPPLSDKDIPPPPHSNGRRPSASSSSGDEESITDATLSTMPKPRGLIDALTSFFTPTDKRKSRVSLSSRTVIPVIARPYAGKKRGRPKAVHNRNNLDGKSKTQQTTVANKLIKKSCQLQVIKHRKQKQHERKNHRNHKNHPPSPSESNSSPSSPSSCIPSCSSQRLGRPKGSDQVKSLFDGLSHLYCAKGDRRPLPASVFGLPPQPSPPLPPPLVPQQPIDTYHFSSSSHDEDHSIKPVQQKRKRGRPRLKPRSPVAASADEEEEEELGIGGSWWCRANKKQLKPQGERVRRQTGLKQWSQEQAMVVVAPPPAPRPPSSSISSVCQHLQAREQGREMTSSDTSLRGLKYPPPSKLSSSSSSGKQHPSSVWQQLLLILLLPVLPFFCSVDTAVCLLCSR